MKAIVTILCLPIGTRRTYHEDAMVGGHLFFVAGVVSHHTGQQRQSEDRRGEDEAIAIAHQGSDQGAFGHGAEQHHLKQCGETKTRYVHAKTYLFTLLFGQLHLAQSEEDEGRQHGEREQQSEWSGEHAVQDATEEQATDHASHRETEQSHARPAVGLQHELLISTDSIPTGPLFLSTKKDLP